MTTVGIRALKAHLSQHLRRVQAGERVQVTDRGKVIAEIGPPGGVEAVPGLPEWLKNMARKGQATLPSRPKRTRYAFPARRLLKSGTARELIDAERHEDWQDD